MDRSAKRRSAQSCDMLQAAAWAESSTTRPSNKWIERPARRA
jgi:hypothetical protein